MAQQSALVLYHHLNFTPNPIPNPKWTVLRTHLRLSSKRVALQALLSYDAAFQPRSANPPFRYLSAGGVPALAAKFDAFEPIAGLCCSTFHRSPEPVSELVAPGRWLGEAAHEPGDFPQAAHDCDRVIDLGFDLQLFVSIRSYAELLLRSEYRRIVCAG